MSRRLYWVIIILLGMAYGWLPWLLIDGVREANPLETPASFDIDQRINMAIALIAGLAVYKRAAIIGWSKGWSIYVFYMICVGLYMFMTGRHGAVLLIDLSRVGWPLISVFGLIFMFGSLDKARADRQMRLYFQGAAAVLALFLTYLGHPLILRSFFAIPFVGDFIFDVSETVRRYHLGAGKITLLISGMFLATLGTYMVFSLKKPKRDHKAD